MNVFADFETTGLSATLNDIITGALIITDDKGRELATIEFKCKPISLNRWDEGAAKVHGFTMKETLEWPNPRETAYNIYHELMKYVSRGTKYNFWYHGLNGFDFVFLENFFRSNMTTRHFYDLFDVSHSTIDLLKIMVNKGNLPPLFNKMVRSKGKPRPSYKLDLWAKHFNIELDHHNASSDARACFEIWKKCKKQNPRLMF